MRTLWKKDTSSGQYIDLFLFATNRDKKRFEAWTAKLHSNEWKHCYLNLKIEPVKSNNVSISLRGLGDEKFRSKNMIAAMEHYNQSLIFAETGTRNFALAYSNRSACFFNMKMYFESLIDIELAKKTNYPGPWLQKLEQRKVACLKLMQQHGSKKFYGEPKLSFDAAENFPCMANVLTIKRNDKYGRYVEAKCDIDVGQTVLVEERFNSDTFCNDFVRCLTCDKECKNFIPCSNCTDVMFCSDDCMDNNRVHKLTCGASYHRLYPQIRLLVKSVLLGITTFPTSEKLMSFVEETLTKSIHEVPAASSDLESKYRLFLTLYKRSVKIDLFVVHQVYTSLMSIKSISKLFDSKQKQNFLIHLIGQHYVIEATNGHDDDSDRSTTNVLCLFNHSCAPNLFNMYLDKREILVTTRPIKKGDQLFVAYLGFDQTTEVRQALLKMKFEIQCKCEKCKPNCKPSDREMMKSDQCYRYLMNDSTVDLTNEVQRSQRKLKCIEFLQKFGHLPWSDEMELVIDAYEDCILRLNIFLEEKRMR